MDQPKSDPLSVFLDKEICSTCGSVCARNLSRCPECGTFHRQDLLADRRVTTEMEAEAARHLKPADPGMYNLNPLASLAEEKEEDVPDVTTGWSDSNTDFSFADDVTRAPALIDRRRFLDSIKSDPSLENEPDAE